MSIRRRSILVFSILLAVATALLPLGAALRWAWQRALVVEQDKLASVAAAAAARAHAILERVDGTLSYLRRLPGDACSEQAMANMRARTIGNRDIDEIGHYHVDYLDHDGQAAGARVACNSWGSAGRMLMLPAGPALPGSQLRLDVASASPAGPGVRLIGVYDRGMYAYVEPGRFADVALPPEVQLAVLTRDGRIVAGRGGPDWHLVEVLARLPGNGVTEAEGSLFLRRTDTVFKVVVSVPLGHVAASAARSKLIWMPLVLGVSLLGALAVGWRARRCLSRVGELRAAIVQGQLSVHYQPIIDLASGRCVGAEAMARWRHPTDGWIAPDEFIALAEKHHLVSAITEHVLRTVAAELGATLRAHPELHVAVNLSAHDMHEEGPLRHLQALLDAHGIACRQLWLEVTERALTDVDAACLVLEPLRQRGHRIAVDDFGTGYSSLSYLQALPLDVLKIDKAFVDAVGHGEVSSCVIDHIIGMASSLGLAIVAEGIEDAAQADWLRARHVDYGQGWVFARAMPAVQFIAFCEAAASMMGDPGQDQRDGGQRQGSGDQDGA